MSVNGITLLGRVAGALAVINLLWSGTLSGQQHSESERDAEISGCYVITVERNDGGEWMQHLEQRVWLTTVELARSPMDSQSVPLLMRPAPGERASAYALSYWTSLPDGNVQLAWSSGTEIITVVFTPRDARAVALSGTATYFSDALDAPPSELPVKVQRADCHTDP